DAVDATVPNGARFESPGRQPCVTTKTIRAALKRRDSTPASCAARHRISPRWGLARFDDMTQGSAVLRPGLSNLAPLGLLSLRIPTRFQPGRTCSLQKSDLEAAMSLLRRVLTLALLVLAALPFAAHADEKAEAGLAKIAPKMREFVEAKQISGA